MLDPELLSTVPESFEAFLALARFAEVQRGHATAEVRELEVGTHRPGHSGRQGRRPPERYRRLRRAVRERSCCNGWGLAPEVCSR